MSTFKNLILLMIIGLSLFSCKSAQQMFNNGNYNGALMKSVKKIKAGKAKRADVALAQRSMEKLDQQVLSEIEELVATNRIKKWKSAYKKYDDLIEKHEDFGKLVKFKSERATELKAEKEALRNDIVDYHMEEGYALIAESYDKDNKIYARESYLNFQEADRYGGDYEEIDSMLEVSFNRSVLYYTIDVNNMNIGFVRNFDVEDISDNHLVIEETFSCDDCDCEIDLDIDRIDFDDRIRERTQSYSERIQDGTTTERDTAGNTVNVPVYKDVRAEVLIREIVRQARISADMRVWGRTNSCQIDNEYYNFEIESEGVEYEVSGDERALPPNLDLRSRRPERDDDLEEELYELLYDALEDDLDRN